MEVRASNLSSNSTSCPWGECTGGDEQNTTINSQFKVRNVIIGSLGVLINTIAFFVVIKSKKVTGGRKIILLNFIVSDILLMITLFAYGLDASTHISSSRNCAVVVTALTISLFSSYLLALQISTFTFLAVHKAFQYKMLVTPKNTCIILTVIWLVSIICCAVVLWSGIPPGYTCAPTVVIKRDHLALLSIVMMFSFIGVILLNLYVFVKIKNNRRLLFRPARNHKKPGPALKQNTTSTSLRIPPETGFAKRNNDVLSATTSAQLDLGFAPNMASSHSSGLLQGSMSTQMDSGLTSGVISNNDPTTISAQSASKSASPQNSSCILKCSMPIKMDSRLTPGTIPFQVVSGVSQGTVFAHKDSGASPNTVSLKRDTELPSRTDPAILDLGITEIDKLDIKKLAKRSNRNRIKPMEEISNKLGPTCPSPCETQPRRNHNVQQATNVSCLARHHTYCEFVPRANPPLSLVHTNNAQHVTRTTAEIQFDMTPKASDRRVTTAPSGDHALGITAVNSKQSLSIDKLRKTLLVLTTYSCLLTLPSVIYLMCIVTGVIEDPEAMVGTPVGIFVSSCPTVRASINPIFYLLKFAQLRELINKIREHLPFCRRRTQ